MAKIEDVMGLFRNVEFSNDNSKLLHKNPTETGLTFYGIYETAHPKWEGWNIIKRYLKIEPDLKKCSVVLSNNIELDLMVQNFYKKEFWDKSKLDLVNSQKVANQIFIFSTNIGVNKANKEVQKLLNVTVDGIIGSQTIQAINEKIEDDFIKSFKSVQKAYYKRLVDNNPNLEICYKGWINRVDKVA